MNIKDYLHLYLGCEVTTPDRITRKLIGVEGDAAITYGKYGRCVYSTKDTKPILRPLSDMTPEEEEEWLSGREETRKAFQGKFVDNDYATHCGFCDGGSALHLLTKGFDLFGLIDAGLALDKTKHMQRP